jgi:hypothetical protein
LPYDEDFDHFVEALAALATIDKRHRDALRRAVELSAESEELARVQVADQQRMYDQAERDALGAQRLLAELRSVLGLSEAVDPTETPLSGNPPQLVQIRAEIRDVAQWTEGSMITAESLIRTRERLRKAPPTAPPAPAREFVGEDSPAAKALGPNRIAMVSLLAIATLVFVALVITR